jgi:hypothetical protein
MDRLSRACNIILFNVPDLLIFNAVQQNDTTIIDEMFNTIGVSTKPLSIHPLGKPLNKPDHIRIVMISPSDVVFQMFKVKWQLFNDDKLKTVRVVSNQMLQQCKLYSFVTSELKLRKMLAKLIFLLSMLITVRSFQKMVNELNICKSTFHLLSEHLRY